RAQREPSTLHPPRTERRTGVTHPARALRATPGAGDVGDDVGCGQRVDATAARRRSPWVGSYRSERAAGRGRPPSQRDAGTPRIVLQTARAKVTGPNRGLQYRALATRRVVEST